MNFIKTLIATFTFGFALTTAQAGEFGTKEEAIALVNNAIAYTKSVGPEKAFEAFNDPKGKYVDRDLYLVVFNKDGIRVAHGANAKMIGKSAADSVDVNGKNYGVDIMKTIQAGEGWVEYSFADPITKKVLPKALYIKRSGDYAFGSGIYIR